MSETGRRHRWEQTCRLAAATLVGCGVVILLFLALADPEQPEGYPTGFVLAATGLPVLILVIVVWFIQKQDGIDRSHRLFED